VRGSTALADLSRGKLILLVLVARGILDRLHDAGPNTVTGYDSRETSGGVTHLAGALLIVAFAGLVWLMGRAIISRGE